MLAIAFVDPNNHDVIVTLATIGIIGMYDELIKQFLLIITVFNLGAFHSLPSICMEENSFQQLSATSLSELRA